MLNFTKSNNQNDFISIYSLPIYKQIAPQFFRKTNKRNKYLSFYQKQPRLFFIPLHIRLATPQQFKQT